MKKMGERPRKKPPGLWKKAVLHFCMCFFVGFFTGFTPSTTSGDRHVTLDDELVPSLPTVHSLVGESPATRKVPEIAASPRRQLILVTPMTRGGDPLRLALLRRLAGTVKLVPPPVTWIVVEKAAALGSEDEVSEMLRKTGVMYRHLVVKEKFAAAEVEVEHHRNVALEHIEHHRVVGIVHFADLANVYDLDFFRELRQIEVFGSWPMAVLSDQREVIIQGPVCNSSQVKGCHINKMNNKIDEKAPIHISSFAFNSSILWRRGRRRPSSTTDLMKLVKKAVKKAGKKALCSIKGVAGEKCSFEQNKGEKCSRILLWHLFPFSTLSLSLLASDNM